MTVSQIFFNRQVINAETNMESYRKEIDAEAAKGKDGDVKRVRVPEYSQDDELFMLLVKTLALSTKTKFQYQPLEEEVKNWYKKDCKKAGKKAWEMGKKKELWSAEAKAAYDVADLAMIAEEKARRFVKRATKGDASETGLIRFLTPILMKEFGGPVEIGDFENALEEIRN